MLNLVLKALLKFFTGFLLVVLLVFLPAGTFMFFNGLIFLLILFVPMIFLGVYLLLKKPQLLNKRLNVKEMRKEQSIVVKLSGVMFILGFIVAGLNFRFKAYLLPKNVVIIASIIFIIGYALYAEVLRENEFLSRTIEVSKNQTVVTTGLYGVVRHPMYLASVIMFLSIPLVLGSLYSFIIFMFYPIIIIKRINDEEKLLVKELNGYREYKLKVKYRLIPFVW